MQFNNPDRLIPNTVPVDTRGSKSNRDLLEKDREGNTTDHYINLSSANRDKAVDPSSDDVTYYINQGIRDALSIEVEQFEIPHTRYAITSSNNTLYISENVNGEYFFFGLMAGTGGYTISELAVSMELSTLSPTAYIADSVLTNTYSFVTSSSLGKVAIISSGDVEYNIHNCRETLQIVKYSKVSDTEATATFIAPYEYILAPGALCTLNVYDKSDREVQVVEVTASRTVTLMGDFSELEDDDVDLTRSKLVPYSSINSISDVSGFGLVDQEITSAKYELLGAGSPFGTEIVGELSNPMFLTKMAPFLSLDDTAVITGTNSFFEGQTLTVTKTHDDNHFNLEVDVSQLWDGTSITVDNGATTYNVVSISLVSSEMNVVTLLVTADSATTFEQDDIVTFTGLTHSELNNVVITVASNEISTDAFTVSFTYDTSVLFNSGSTYVTPINSDTGLATTFLAPSRYDLSRGRRVIICRATIDGVDVGTLIIPGDPTVYFARIQLFSGGDLVTFATAMSAVGKYRFSGRVKNLRTIRLRFYEESGVPYNFSGTEFSLFLRVRSALGYIA